MTEVAGRDLPLNGMHILVVDDEWLIAMTVEETLTDAGAEITSASTLTDALKGAEEPILSAAILDVRLGMNTTEAVADKLVSRNIPFVFHSGQMLSEPFLQKYPRTRLIAKPVRPEIFVEAILEATGASV